MSAWFEINNEEVYYKKISTYDEYLKYKENWNSIIEMSKKDFEDNFIVVIIASWRMPGIKIANISANNDTLYVELDKTVTKEEIEKENYMLSTKISNKLDREKLIVRNVIKEISSDKFKKLEELPKKYSKEQAEKDGCIVIYDNILTEESKIKLQNFIEATRNNEDDYIRIATYNKSLMQDDVIETTIVDIQYINNEYLYYIDSTRNSLGEKSIRYIDAYQKIGTKLVFNNYTLLYLENLLGTVSVTIYFDI